jgi:hypothetical protein
MALDQFMAIIKTGFKSDRTESLEYRLHKTVDRVEILRRDRLINRLNSPYFKMFYVLHVQTIRFVQSFFDSLRICLL